TTMYAIFFTVRRSLSRSTPFPYTTLFRSGEPRAAREVLLVVQADADAIGHAPAAAGPLVCRSLADRQTSGPAAAGAWPMASASACTTRRTSRAARGSPDRKSVV